MSSRLVVSSGGGCSSSRFASMSMTTGGFTRQFDSQNEVLSLMFKAYIVSLVLVIIVLVWTATDAWVQYAEFCYFTGSLITGANYTHF